MRWPGRAPSPADATGQARPFPAPAGRGGGLSTAGSPLPLSEREFFERRFGVDLGPVRVHHGPIAAAAARQLGAQAFTIGTDVAFAAGRYAPGTAGGRRLLAHELAHVVRQRTDTAGVARQVDPSVDVPRAGRYQLPSELLPPGRLRDSSDHAASIYFATKSSTTDHDDQEVLRAVAERYRDVTRQRGGLTGRVIGHADIERSAGPDNQQLSDQRARSTAAALASYLAGLASVPPERIRFTVIGEGTGACQRDPDCAGKVRPAALARYRRADVLVAVKPSAPATPADCRTACGPLLGSCEFYRCRAHHAGPAHTPDTYYLGYGLKYCERFSKLTRPQLSPAGRNWLDKTLFCLQRYVHERIPCDSEPGLVKKMAFASHPDCYVLSGLCFLPPRDWSVILSTIDLADNDLKQVLVTTVYCAGNILPMMFPMHSLAAGGGYRGLMERDRQRVFGRGGGIRPFGEVEAGADRTP